MSSILTVHFTYSPYAIRAHLQLLPGVRQPLAAPPPSSDYPADPRAPRR